MILLTRAIRQDGTFLCLVAGAAAADTSTGGEDFVLKTDFIKEREIAKNRKETFSWNHV